MIVHKWQMSQVFTNGKTQICICGIDGNCEQLRFVNNKVIGKWNPLGTGPEWAKCAKRAIAGVARPIFLEEIILHGVFAVMNVLSLQLPQKAAKFKLEGSCPEGGG